MIEDIHTKGQLAAFITGQIEKSPRAVLIQQLQGKLRWGTGSPETVVTAPVGTAYLREDGGAGTTLYIKESGSGATGWVGK